MALFHYHESTYKSLELNHLFDTNSHCSAGKPKAEPGAQGSTPQAECGFQAVIRASSGPSCTIQRVFSGTKFMAKAATIAKKQLELREALWPSVEEKLWDRNIGKGFASLPKTMPIILKIMDSMSEKGKPVSSTYLALWCSTWDNAFVVVRGSSLPFSSGFGGQRSLQTWSARMKILKNLGFIDYKPGRGLEIGYVIIFNPHTVIVKHYEEKSKGIREDDYVALLELAQEFGIKDIVSTKKS